MHSLHISETKFKEISSIVQGAIDFLSSISPRRKTDQQRGEEIIQLLNKVNVDREINRFLKICLAEFLDQFGKRYVVIFINFAVK